MPKTKEELLASAADIQPAKPVAMAARSAAAKKKYAAPAKKKAPAKKAKAAAVEPDEEDENEEEEAETEEEEEDGENDDNSAVDKKVDAEEAAEDDEETDGDDDAADDVEEEVAPEPMEASGEPTAHDYLLDVARAVQPKFADQTSKEGDQVYFQRLITAISDEKQDDEGNAEFFDSMPAEAQDWFNEQGPLMEKGQEITAPVGFVSKFGGKAKAATKPAKAEKAAKGEKSAKTKKEKAPKVEGIVARVRRLQLANLGKTKAEICAMVPEVNPGTVGVQFGWLRDTIADIKAAGHWKD